MSLEIHLSVQGINDILSQMGVKYTSRWRSAYTEEKLVWDF